MLTLHSLGGCKRRRKSSALPPVFMCVTSLNLYCFPPGEDLYCKLYLSRMEQILEAEISPQAGFIRERFISDWGVGLCSS